MESAPDEVIPGPDDRDTMRKTFDPPRHAFGRRRREQPAVERPTVAAAVGAAAALLLLASFALPVRTWRTGERPQPPLLHLASEANPQVTGALWIDTDPACGTGPRRDPDDCLALLAVLRQHAHRVEGLSTVFGNAPLDTTDRVARELVSALERESGRRIAVHRGCAERACRAPEPAQRALAAALARGPLSIVALGPLTNVARVLEENPALAHRTKRVIAIMGRRPGHLFHPAEGRTREGILFGHGPIFRDLNAVLDPEAVATVLRAGVPLTLLSYSAARHVTVTAGDLDRLGHQRPAGAWAAARARQWLGYWQADVGLDGFYPFDLMAAAYLDDPTRFRCAAVTAWIGRDRQLPLLPFASALLVADGPTPADAEASAQVTYCDVATVDVGNLLRPAP